MDRRKTSRVDCFRTERKSAQKRIERETDERESCVKSDFHSEKIQEVCRLIKFPKLRLYNIT